MAGRLPYCFEGIGLTIWFASLIWSTESQAVKLANDKTIRRDIYTARFELVQVNISFENS
jgi:hypothetical protein